MKTLDEILRIIQEHKHTLHQQFGVSRIGIFGSYARSESTDISDVDIFVDFERPIGWEIVDLQHYLENILNLKVDLVTAGALRRKKLLWQSIREDLVYA